MGVSVRIHHVLQMGDAVQQIGVLVKHELVTFVQNGQKPPPCFGPVLDTASLEQNPFSFVGPVTLGPPRARLVRELDQVFSVLKASKVDHHEKIKGHVGLCRFLGL